MQIEAPVTSRPIRMERLDADLVIVGGGMAGACAAITAGRLGVKVVLMQDRPVLGGNASSEVRLWVLGATCHMASNNRYAREGGVINELLVENLYRNPEGNPLIFDTILLEKVVELPNIRLLLNTSALACGKTPDNPDRIAWVEGYCSQNSTRYHVRAPLFLDASGDGVLGFLSGAAFRMGAEKREEFDEAFCRGDEFGHLLGHSIYFYSKDTGRPVRFVPPSFALKNVPQHIPRYKQLNARQSGCHLWWIEWGGRLDTVHETENIKWELWRIVYGVWDYIKNSGQFPEAANLTLEWVGHIPGKRESRRFEGPYMLSQKDVVERRRHDDDVAFGGWSIDLHPADGVYSPLAGSHHLHSKGIYPIPLRCLYSRNIPNLFFAGRIISATHVAFGSTRVMGTGAHCGQAVAHAAALCKRHSCDPHDLHAPERLATLQRELLRGGQHIPGIPLNDPDDLARRARITSDSRLILSALPADGPGLKLDDLDVAQLLPFPAGRAPTVTFTVDATRDAPLTFELRRSSDPLHFTPDVTLARLQVNVAKGERQKIQVRFDATLDRAGYVFLCVMKTAGVALATSLSRVTGLVSLRHRRDERASAVGGEDYQIWSPWRRPEGHNFAVAIDPPIDLFGPDNLTNGYQRPTQLPNAYIAALDARTAKVKFDWPVTQKVGRIELFFDVDYDHAMESCLYGHPESVVPFVVKRFRLLDDQARVLGEVDDNHQARRTILLTRAAETRSITVELLETQSPDAPPALMEVRCYES